MIQKIAEGKSVLGRRPDRALTATVMGCLIRNAAIAATDNASDTRVKFPPAKMPISRGEKRKTQEPWSWGIAMIRLKMLLMVMIKL